VQNDQEISRKKDQKCEEEQIFEKKFGCVKNRREKKPISSETNREYSEVNRAENDVDCDEDGDFLKNKFCELNLEFLKF
jgi:hypothetical protein